MAALPRRVVGGKEMLGALAHGRMCELGRRIHAYMHLLIVLRPHDMT